MLHNTLGEARDFGFGCLSKRPLSPVGIAGPIMLASQCASAAGAGASSFSVNNIALDHRQHRHQHCVELFASPWPSSVRCPAAAAAHHHTTGQVKKRARCLSPQVSERSRHRSSEKKMSTSSSSSSPPAEPSTKRILRDVLAVNPDASSSTSAPPGVIVTSGISADFLAEAERWRKELDKLSGAARSHHQQNGDSWTWTQAVPLAVSMARTWTRFAGQGGGGCAVTFGERNKTDRLSCAKCGGVLHCAVTMACGHSFCRKCASSSDHCAKCGRLSFVQQQHHQPTGNVQDADSAQKEPLRSNVTVQRLVEKWWAHELRAVDLRNDGNKAFAEQRYDEALDKYNQAVQSAPADFTSLSNRSNVLAKTGKFEEALKDAELVIRLRPDWAKGYYRRAVALRGLGRHDDAILAFLHCAAMERALLADVRDDIAKLLYTVITNAVKQQSAQAAERGKASEASSGSSGDESSMSSSDDGSNSPTASNPPSTSEDSEDELRRSPQRMSSLTLYNPHVNAKCFLLVDRIVHEFERFKKMAMNVQVRVVDDPQNTGKVDGADFECTLCCRLMWHPVTTPCGHSFCRTCLDRCLDHTPSCPLCKTSLEQYLAERRQSLTEFLDYAMATYLPDEYAERSKLHDEEMKELASSENIPIFICTMAYPTVRCPLHVFEPRYRLMIRRCMESGSRQFGMCSYVRDQPHGFAEYGTMLEVRDVEFFADGRSVVDTVGGRRFRVLERGVLDGYSTASVEYLRDQPVEPDRVAATRALHDSVRHDAESWINSAPNHLRERILQHFGTMPPVEPDWMSLPDGPAWLWWLMAILPLNPKAQVAILSMTQVEKRLEAVQRGVTYVRQRTL